MKGITRLIDLIAALCIQKYWQFLYVRKSSGQRDAVAAKWAHRAKRTGGQTPFTET
ncbi:hypothetical protein ACVWZ4_000977 [Bradyrhizobium sp. USDA 4472]